MLYRYIKISDAALETKKVADDLKTSVQKPVSGIEDACVHVTLSNFFGSDMEILKRKGFLIGSET